ncbi:MAG: hypothetical protein JWL73_581 [Actinomycetia bacterium]|nr:hypothetical protein [Actinomycetes bacterium]
MRHRRRVHAADSGFGTLEFVVGVAILLIPVMLLVLQIPRWLEYQDFARSAVAEASRVCAGADTAAEGQLRAVALVAAMAPNYGIRDAGASGVLSVTCAGAPEPGATVVATVRVDAPALVFPGFGRGTYHATWSVSHAEIVDPYRSYDR